MVYLRCSLMYNSRRGLQDHTTWPPSWQKYSQRPPLTNEHDIEMTGTVLAKRYTDGGTSACARIACFRSFGNLMAQGCALYLPGV